MKKIRKIILILVIIMLPLIIFLHMQNNWLEVTKYEIEFDNLPESFNGYKLVHISDLHDSNFGNNHEILIKEVEKLNPDIIVISGDFIDRTRFDLERSMKFIEGVVNKYDVYYVTGNHEFATRKTNEIVEALRSAGVTVLRDEKVQIKKGDDVIDIVGIDDPLFREDLPTFDIDKFTIMISHRSELTNYYRSSNVDVVFTGHAHGGQFRFFNQGIASPGQGWLPKYSQGVHDLDNTKLVISRGLGNSLFQQRLFNRPEIVFVEFKK